MFAVDYPTPPYAQRSLIPRAKGSNGQLREASFEKITTSKQGHVAFLQKPPQDLRLDTLPEKGEGKSKISGASPLTPTRDKPDSQWIHRDKLAQIERQELREMESRLDELESRDVQASAGMKDTLISGGNDGHTVEAEEPISKRQRVDSPLNHEMGSREGLTPAVSSSMGYSTPTKTIDVRKDSRTGSSRIPVARSSPVAYSNSPERLTPGQTRVRLVPNPNGSIQYSKPRDRRVGDAVSPGGSSVRPLSATFTPSPLSVSGQTLPSADDVPVVKTRPPSRGPSGTQSRQGSVSRNTSNAKKRLSSGPVNGISPRPGSSSGTRRTRGPINRPEGEAPWIADMYKPDPMIPPDEQIVPTHAKLLGLHLKDAADGSSQDEAEPTAPQDFVDTPTKAIFGSETIPEVDRFEELEVEHKVNGGKDMYPTFLAWTDGSLRSKPIEPVVGGDQTLAGIQEIPQADLRLPLRSDTPTATAQVSEQRDRSRSRSRSRVRAEAILPLVSATTPQPENLKLSSPRALVSRPSVEQPHGGYKIMPTVRSPAQMEEDLLRHPVLRGTSPTRAASRQSTTAQSSQPVRQDSRINTTLAKPQQVLPSPTPVKAAKPIRAMNMEDPANEKVKKGCGGCCAVM